MVQHKHTTKGWFLRWCSSIFVTIIPVVKLDVKNEFMLKEEEV